MEHALLNLTIFNRIFIGNTLFLIESLQGGPEGCSRDPDKARVQLPRDLLHAQPQAQHSNSLVQI